MCGSKPPRSNGMSTDELLDGPGVTHILRFCALLRNAGVSGKFEAVGTLVFVDGNPRYVHVTAQDKKGRRWWTVI